MGWVGLQWTGRHYGAVDELLGGGGGQGSACSARLCWHAGLRRSACPASSLTALAAPALNRASPPPPPSHTHTHNHVHTIPRCCPAAGPARHVLRNGQRQHGRSSDGHQGTTTALAEGGGGGTLGGCGICRTMNHGANAAAAAQPHSNAPRFTRAHHPRVCVGHGYELPPALQATHSSRPCASQAPGPHSHPTRSTRPALLPLRLRPSAAPCPWPSPCCPPLLPTAAAVPGGP